MIFWTCKFYRDYTAIKYQLVIVALYCKILYMYWMHEKLYQVIIFSLFSNILYMHWKQYKSTSSSSIATFLQLLNKRIFALVNKNYTIAKYQLIIIALCCKILYMYWTYKKLYQIVIFCLLCNLLYMHWKRYKSTISSARSTETPIPAGMGS